LRGKKKKEKERKLEKGKRCLIRRMENEKKEYS